MKKKLWVFSFFLLIFAAGAGYICFRYYEFVFSKEIQGQVLRVERVNQQQAIIAGGPKTPDEQLFSFAISIKDEKGVIHTASSEDRQWAVVSQGQCVQARFFPYPPWELANAGTYHNARLLHIVDCPQGVTPVQSATPTQTAAPTPATSP